MQLRIMRNKCLCYVDICAYIVQIRINHMRDMPSTHICAYVFQIKMLVVCRDQFPWSIKSTPLAIQFETPETGIVYVS